MKYPLKSIIPCFLFWLSLSCVHAQGAGPFIPYRDHNKWGFADTSGNIVLQPAFDSVWAGYWFPEGSPMFAVRQGAKPMLVNRAGKRVVKAPFDAFAIDQFAIRLTTQKKTGLYLFNGKEVLPQVYTKCAPIQLDFYEVTDAQGKKGLVKVDAAAKRAQWLLEPDNYKFISGIVIGDTVHFAAVKAGKARYYNYYKGKFVLISAEDSSVREREMVEEIEDGGRVAAPEEMLNVFQYSRIPVGKKFKMVRKWSEQEGYRVTPVRQDTIEGALFDQVTLIPLPKVLVDAGDFPEGKKTLGNIALAKRNGKWGIWFGREIANESLLFDSIVPVIVPLNCKSVCFKVQNNQKWGLVTIFGATVLPLEYDDLLSEKEYVSNLGRVNCFSMNGLVARKNGKYGILSSVTTTVVPFVIDSMEQKIRGTGKWETPVRYFYLYQNGKTGLYDPETGYLPPQYIASEKVIYEGYTFYFSRPSDIDSNLKYPLVAMRDKMTGQLLGYYDLKGFAYFKD